MDEVESVNRGEAVAGLSLLAATMLALVGTFVFRLVEKPTSVRSTADGALAIDTSLVEPGAVLDEADPPESTIASDSSTVAPPASPIPIEAADVPNAAPLASAETQAPEFQSHPATAPQETINRPHFVAPASRAAQ